MNLSDMREEVKQITGRNDTAFAPRIDRAINRALRTWAKTLPWDALKRVITVTHRGGRELALPDSVLRVCWLVDKTNTQEVEAASGQWDREWTYDYSKDTAGYAFEWEPAGRRPVFTSVSGPLALYCASASSIVTVYVQGQVADGAASNTFLDYYESGESVALVGATPVTTTKSYIDVYSIVKADDLDDLIRLECQGSIVGRIGPYDLDASYPWVRFMHVPNAGVEFKAGVYCKPAPLTNAYQAPPASVDPDFLIWDAASDILWQLKEGERATNAHQKAMDFAKNFRGVEKQFGDGCAQIVPDNTGE